MNISSATEIIAVELNRAYTTYTLIFQIKSFRRQKILRMYLEISRMQYSYL